MNKKSFDKKRAENIQPEDRILNEKENVNTADETTKDANGNNSKQEEVIDSKENKEETKETKEIKDEKEITETINPEIENLNNKLLRLQADYLNYKNRTEKEKTATYCNAVADVIQDLLTVVDNLERALKTDTSIDNNFKDGVQMIYDQFVGILDKKGLREIEALHKPFDHNLHYGVAFDAGSEEEDGTVIEVFQKGYIVNNKVIRPSMVKIAKK